MGAIFYTERFCSIVGHNIPLLNQDGQRELHCLWHQECLKRRGGCHNRWIFPLEASSMAEIPSGNVQDPSSASRPMVSTTRQ